MAEFLAVKNYQKHQHYKDRDPVWIKFYVAVLSDPAITRLTESAQCQLFKLWLLASRHGNRIPFTSAKDKGVVRSAISPTAKFRLEELLAAGLLSKISENASKKLDESYALAGADARSGEEVEEVRGKRLEQANNTTTTARAALRERTPGELAVLEAVPEGRRKKLGPLFDGWREGLGMAGGRAAEDVDISTGLLELMSNLEEGADLNAALKAAHMASYVDKARTRRLQPNGNHPKRGGSFLDVT